MEGRVDERHMSKVTARTRPSIKNDAFYAHTIHAQGGCSNTFCIGKKFIRLQKELCRKDIKEKQ